MNNILLICLIICLSMSSASLASSSSPSMVVKNLPLSPGKISTLNQGEQGLKNTCANDECNGVCTNTQSDRSNCGGCGVVCDSGWKCLQGSCVAPKTKSGVVTFSKLNNTQPSGHNVSKSLKTGSSAANLSAINLSTTNQSATNISAAYISARQKGGIGPISPTGSIGGVKLGFSCEGIYCTCAGDADCNDMFLHGGCGDVAQCRSDGTCWCFKQL